MTWRMETTWITVREASETADVDKAAGTDPSGTAGEPGKEDLSLMAQIKEKMQGIYDKLPERRHGYQVPDRQSRIYDQGVGSFLREIRQCAGCHPGGTGGKIEKEKVERLEEKLTGMSETAEEPDEVDSILAQSVKTTEEGSDPKTWYITCFSEDGIWCKKFTEGQEGEDLWRMEFTDPSQYQKVLNYLQSFAEGEEVPHAEEEDFWRRFLEEDAR